MKRREWTAKQKLQIVLDGLKNQVSVSDLCSSLREQFDTTTAMGKAMLRVALVFAQLEREQNSERVSDVMA